MTRILTIEDDAVTAKEIVAELSSHGLQVDWVDNGREGLVRAVSGDYDLITLDRMLPEVDGLAIVTTMRALGIATPILMISALSDVDERVRGLRANASKCSHAELDAAETLDDGDPEELGGDYAALLRRFPGINVLGGCCGTDLRHVAAIARQGEIGGGRVDVRHCKAP